jgi:hypothetical protein
VKAATDAVASFVKLAEKSKHDDAKCKKACKAAQGALQTAGDLKLSGDIGKTWPMEVARYAKLLWKFPK